MITSIGRNLHDTRARAALAIGLLAVGLDLWVVWLNRYPASAEGRWAIALAALAAQFWLAGGDLPSVGLNAPSGGWWSWVRWGCYIGLVVGVCLGVAAGLWLAVGLPLPIHSVAPSEVVPAFFHMCVFAPLLEETIYRVALCVPLASFSPKAAVAAIGAAFGLLHVVYGNPSPENLLGGFFIAWAYLRSGSVCVPVLLHAAGNLLALAGQVGGWYYLAGRG